MANGNKKKRKNEVVEMPAKEKVFSEEQKLICKMSATILSGSKKTATDESIAEAVVTARKVVDYVLTV